MLLLVVSPALLAQSQDETAAQIQALQKQLDSLQAQMTTVQGEITKLSAGSGGTPANVTGTGAVANTQPQGAPDTATELKVSTQDIGKATSAYETTSQDQLAAPRFNNEPLDPRYRDTSGFPARVPSCELGVTSRQTSFMT
jgi:hypothetical protein